MPDVDFNYINDKMLIGGYITSQEDFDGMIDLGVTHFVCLLAENEKYHDAAYKRSDKVRVLCVHGYDDHKAKSLSWYKNILDFVSMALFLEPNSKIYMHCFPPGTMIDSLVPEPIESIQEVMSHDGKIHKVLNHMSKHYEGNLISIKSTGADVINCTPEHPFYILKAFKNSNGQIKKPNWSLNKKALKHYEKGPQWMNAENLKVGDYLLSPRPNFEGDKFEINWIYEGTHKNLIELNPLIASSDIAWMLGFYVADGGTTGKNGINFTTSKIEHANKIKLIWGKMGINAKIKDFGKYQKINIASRIVANSFGQWFGKGNNKKFPDWIFKGWPLKDVLNGISDGDGHLDKKGNMTITTISPILARQLHLILRFLGESPTLKKLKRYSGFKNAKPSEVIRWCPKAKQRHTCWWNDYYLMPIKEINNIKYNGLVYNIEIENTETYTVNGVIVHNCAAGRSRSALAWYTVLRTLGFNKNKSMQMLSIARPEVTFFDTYLNNAEEVLRTLNYIK